LQNRLDATVQAAQTRLTEQADALMELGVDAAEVEQFVSSPESVR
jgi:hypothetical protein